MKGVQSKSHYARVCAYMALHPNCSCREAAKGTSIASSRVYDIVQWLVENEFVNRRRVSMGGSGNSIYVHTIVRSVNIEAIYEKLEQQRKARLGRHSSLKKFDASALVSAWPLVFA